MEELEASIGCVCALVWVCGSLMAMRSKARAVTRVGVGIDLCDPAHGLFGQLIDRHGAGHALVADMIGDNPILAAAEGGPDHRALLIFLNEGIDFIHLDDVWFVIRLGILPGKAKHDGLMRLAVSSAEPRPAMRRQTGRSSGCRHC